MPSFTGMTSFTSGLLGDHPFLKSLMTSFYLIMIIVSLPSNLAFSIQLFICRSDYPKHRSNLMESSSSDLIILMFGVMTGHLAPCYFNHPTALRAFGKDHRKTFQQDNLATTLLLVTDVKGSTL